MKKAGLVPVDVSRFTAEQKQSVRAFVAGGDLNGRVFTVGE
jgi:hypothetical protein